MPVTNPGGAVKAGTVAHFAASTAPAGWIKANGAAISRSAYAGLFAAIGTTYGVGDGSTTFNVPDLRGEFLRGWDDARGVDSGRGIGTSQSADIGQHNHSLNSGYTSASGITGSGTNLYYGNATAFTNNSTGTETRPRNVALLACIKF